MTRIDEGHEVTLSMENNDRMSRLREHRAKMLESELFLSPVVRPPGYAWQGEPNAPDPTLHQELDLENIVGLANHYLKRTPKRNTERKTNQVQMTGEAGDKGKNLQSSEENLETKLWQPEKPKPRGKADKERILEPLRHKAASGEIVPYLYWKFKLQLPVIEPNSLEGKHVHSLLRASGGWAEVSVGAALLFHAAFMRSLRHKYERKLFAHIHPAFIGRIARSVQDVKICVSRHDRRPTK